MKSLPRMLLDSAASLWKRSPVTSFAPQDHGGKNSPLGAVATMVSNPPEAGSRLVACERAEEAVANTAMPVAPVSAACSETPVIAEVLREPPEVARNTIRFVDGLPDAELSRLNALLPWAAFVVDGQGRQFGKAYATHKRADAQPIPDPRIVDLDRRYTLSDKIVLELGCFEGIHTVALCERARRVVATDGRIENVVKTIVRAAMFGYSPTVFYWDLESGAALPFDPTCDIAHHVGVLYHLTDPVDHLHRLSPYIGRAILLDTHVASEGEETTFYTSHGDRWAYTHYREGGRESPFAGLQDHAKWLTIDDLRRLLSVCGFAHVDVAHDCKQRNGRRVTIYAHR